MGDKILLNFELPYAFVLNKVLTLLANHSSEDVLSLSLVIRYLLLKDSTVRVELLLEEAYEGVLLFFSLVVVH